MTLEEVQEAVKKEPRKVLIDVYTSWCGPCKMMMHQTFGNDGIIEYINANYYAVKFNAESGAPITFRGQTFDNPNYDPARTAGRNATHQLTYAIANVQGRVAYPTIVYMDEELNIISPVQGFMRPNQIEPILHFVAEEAYKETDWQSYQQNYQSNP